MRRAGRGRARLRAARHRAAAARARRRPGARASCPPASAPSWRRCCPGLGEARERARGARRPGARVRGAAGGARRAVARGAGAARDRGPALGRRVDARVPALPRRDARRRADPARRHLPARRAAPAPPAAPAAGRARARARAADRPRRRSPATSWASSSRTSSARRPSPRWSTACTPAARATRCSRRSCWPPGSTGAARVPPSLAAALALRIERLGDDAQEVVRVLAAGGQLDDAVLAEVAGLDRRALRDGLREAVASHIVVLDGDRYTLRHALLREAVHDELLPGERAELHRALARALERAGRRGRPSAQRAAAIAHHYLAAGDQPAALAAAVRARRRGDGRAGLPRGRDAVRARARAVGPRARRRRRSPGPTRSSLLERAAACHFYADDSSARSRSPSGRWRSSTRRPSRAARPGSTGCCSARCGRCCARTRRSRRSSAASRCSPTTGRAPSAPDCSRARRRR